MAMKPDNSITSKIWPRTDAADNAAALRLVGKRIVFTNGCFDLIHPGHVLYLEEAARLGDILIVGVNTDASVRRLGKSPSRPIQHEDARAIVLAGLASVGAVILFDEDTPRTLISEVLPDVLVKGADYLPEDIAGYDVVTKRGGEVKTIPFVEGYSTSALEQKIIAAHR
jgi:D-glycero-beta-D-manno-heptose 1-phosphate adenylyltransferase